MTSERNEEHTADQRFKRFIDDKVGNLAPTDGAWVEVTGSIAGLKGQIVPVDTIGLSVAHGFNAQGAETIIYVLEAMRDGVVLYTIHSALGSPDFHDATGQTDGAYDEMRDGHTVASNLLDTLEQAEQGGHLTWGDPYLIPTGG